MVATVHSLSRLRPGTPLRPYLVIGLAADHGGRVADTLMLHLGFLSHFAFFETMEKGFFAIRPFAKKQKARSGCTRQPRIV